MKKLLVLILALSIVALMYNESFAEKNTFFDSVKFIQYLDENTALEEVRSGNLDVYYYTNSSLLLFALIGVNLLGTPAPKSLTIPLTFSFATY